MGWTSFSNEAKTVIFGAQEAARSRGCELIELEHAALALFCPPPESTATICAESGVDTHAVAADLLEIAGPPIEAAWDRDMSLSRSMLRLIDGAYSEARELGDTFVGPEHLLLSLLKAAHGLPKPAGWMAFRRQIPPRRSQEEAVNTALTSRGLYAPRVRETVRALSSRTLLRPMSGDAPEELLRPAPATDSDDGSPLLRPAAKG